jgi:CBS domain-containing protein
VIRENREPESLWVMDQMQDEVPTCRLDESVGQAGARAEERGYAVSAVVNENGIVLGVIGKRDWNTDPTA